MPRRQRCLGVNDEQSTCCCCGRRGLKRVVWLLDLHELDVEPAHYGTTCAAHLLMQRLPGEPKPKMAAAEREIAAALDEELTRVAGELLAEVERLPVPEMVEGVNKWGVPVIVCGETEVPFSYDRYDLLTSVDRMRPRVEREWKGDQVFALAQRRGLDACRMSHRARKLIDVRESIR